MEVPSCTEWKINNAMQTFNPNTFVEVGLAGVEAKIAALSMYRGVMYFDFAQHRLFISSSSFGRVYHWFGCHERRSVGM